MKTNRLFRRPFRILPRLALRLAGISSPAGGYRQTAIEAKETALLRTWQGLFQARFGCENFSIGLEPDFFGTFSKLHFCTVALSGLAGFLREGPQVIAMHRRRHRTSELHFH